MATTQLRNSDEYIYFEPMQKSLFRFDPAYTILTTSAAYPSEVNKKDARNQDFSIAPKVTSLNKDYVIKWNDEKEWDRVFDCAESSTAADKDSDDNYKTTATTIELTAGTTNLSSIVPNMVLRVNSTGENLYVTAVDPANAKITVLRAPASGSSDLLDGQTPASTIQKDDKLVVLGTSLFDRDTASDMRSPVYTAPYVNYMQTLDVTYEISENTEYFEFQGGPILPRLTRAGAREASYNLEDVVALSDPSINVDPSNAQNYRYTMMGLIPAIKKWGKINYDLTTMSSDTTLTLDKVQAFESEFRPDDTRPVKYLCSLKALGWFDKILINNLRVTDMKENAVGMRTKLFNATVRTIELVHYPVLDKVESPVDIVRFDPTKYMELVQAKGGWGYKECDKDRPQTWHTYWLHGTFSAKYHLLPDVAGTISGLSSPYSL